jgi:hypothetical protein
VNRQIPHEDATVAAAVVTIVAIDVEVAVGPRDTEVTVSVVVDELPRGGDSSVPLKSQAVKFGALQNPAGRVSFSFELPLNESSCNEDGRIDGNAVYAFASRKLYRLK